MKQFILPHCHEIKKMNKQNNSIKEQNNGSGSQIDTTFIQVGAFQSRFPTFMKAFILFRLHTEREQTVPGRRRGTCIN